MTSPSQVMTRRPVSVTSPMTAAGTSHRLQIAMNAGMSSGRTTAIIRSCDSLMRISSGLSEGSRSGTRLRSTVMPPVPLAANSVVAQETPAAPRSWMPTTTSAA